NDPLLPAVRGKHASALILIVTAKATGNHGRPGRLAKGMELVGLTLKPRWQRPEDGDICTRLDRLDVKTQAAPMLRSHDRDPAVIPSEKMRLAQVETACGNDDKTAGHEDSPGCLVVAQSDSGVRTDSLLRFAAHDQILVGRRSSPLLLVPPIR